MYHAENHPLQVRIAGGSLDISSGNTSMITALSDNPAHIHHLCERLDLGTPNGSLGQVGGGFHHRMWQLSTNCGNFAIKQLADDLDMQDAATVERINATELTARAFSEHGVPALYSLASAQQHLQLLDGVGYLVYPWTDAIACDKNGIEKQHALTVAGILARIHRSDIHVPELRDTPALPLTAERVIDLVQLARQRNVRESQLLEARLDDLLEAAELQAPALSVLQQRQVVSHGDLDHKNVLWTKAGEPLLIDWESARRLNPTYELLLEALDWGGITANFETGPFITFLEAYLDAGGTIVADEIPAVADAIQGAWVEWLLFNVGRAAGLHDAHQRAVGLLQVDLSVSTLLRMERFAPRLTEIALRYAS
jgi:thiamine kinase-like enzyme